MVREEIQMKAMVLVPVPVLVALSVSAGAQSSFDDVVSALRDEATPLATAQAQQEFAVYRRGELPQYPMNMRSIFREGSAALEQAAQRTIGDRVDVRERLPKLLHPNGVCVIGTWKMEHDRAFTGAFAPGTEHLFVGRVSVAMENTTSADKRGFGFAGKLFPTTDPREVVNTENFFSVDILMGAKTNRFLDTATTNEPEVGFDAWLIGFGLKIMKALTTADENPGFRPLKNVASLGLAPGEKAVHPKWLRLSAASATKKNNEVDFRAEVLRAVRENQTLEFVVDGSDTTSDRKATSGWSRLGRIEVREAVVSYGCDRRLHFAHPRLK